MAYAIQCDRCNKFEVLPDDTKRHWPRVFIDGIDEDIGHDPMLRRTGKDVDLCNDCVNELVEWITDLKRPRAVVGTYTKE